MNLEYEFTIIYVTVCINLLQLMAKILLVGILPSVIRHSLCSMDIILATSALMTLLPISLQHSMIGFKNEQLSLHLSSSIWLAPNCA
jgi:hypothetical protein